MRVSMMSAALVAALVGFGSTIALVLAAGAALGATPAQMASWVLGVSLAKAIGSGLLSYWARVPVVLAWSTPGAALIAASSGFGMAEAVGAFLLAAGLIALTAGFRPLGRLVAGIPDPIAAAMLAGVLLPFCLKGAGAAQELGAVVLPMIALFLVVRLVNPAMAVLAALGLGLVVVYAGGWAGWPDLALAPPLPVFTAPEWHLSALLGLGLPLYLVTMAGQNLPGFATMRAHGFEPPVTRALAVTGGASALGALMGAHTVNMAAITAAICMGPDVHPDRAERWKVGLVYMSVWIVLGLMSPAILGALQALPPQVMTALVALALLAPLMGALGGAFAVADQRFAATMTLAVTASGVAVAGIGAAFWGLIAGLAVWGMERARAKVAKARTLTTP